MKESNSDNTSKNKPRGLDGVPSSISDKEQSEQHSGISQKATWAGLIALAIACLGWFALWLIILRP